LKTSYLEHSYSKSNR